MQVLHLFILNQGSKFPPRYFESLIIRSNLSNPRRSDKRDIQNTVRPVNSYRGNHGALIVMITSEASIRPGPECIQDVRASDISRMV